MGNLYHYHVEGVLYDRAFDRESFNWGTRVNNNIRIGNKLRVQLDGNYRSPTVSSQGKREGFLYINGAVRYELIKNRFSAIVQIRDIFGTAEYKRTSEGKDFYNIVHYTREAPIAMLNLRYIFNNYKPERRRDGGGGGDIPDDDF
ncbi:MAG: outer membrane beta-barrel protein [Caldithrix sp.]|nr:outer membrane beta-barrel protein [Caldithrix sp.]